MQLVRPRSSENRFGSKGHRQSRVSSLTSAAKEESISAPISHGEGLLRPAKHV